VNEPLTAGEALRRSTFTEYRKTALTPISDITYPPGTVFQTPEGLRAEDEDTRAAFDVQGNIYPIRESVFRASYEADEGLAGDGLREAAREVDAGWHSIEEGANVRMRYASDLPSRLATLRDALADLDANVEETP